MLANKLLGDAVKKERLCRNLSQNTLAEYAQTSLRTISDIETGKANPRLDTLVPLANYLNISIDSIILQCKAPMDPIMYQIISELNNCTLEEKELALSTLKGLLEGLKKQHN